MKDTLSIPVKHKYIFYKLYVSNSSENFLFYCYMFYVIFAFVIKELKKRDIATLNFPRVNLEYHIVSTPNLVAVRNR